MRRVWVSLLIAAATVALGGVGAQASGGTTAASDGAAVAGATDRAAERATKRGKKRPGCRRFCQQAGGFGGGCDVVEPDPDVPCPAVDILEQTVGGTRDGIVSIKATCELDRACVGAIILNSFKGKFDPPTGNEYGRADLKIPAGETKKVKVGINKKGLKYLKEHGPDKTAFATVPLVEEGTPVSISDDITLLKP
jgi:hypothetical protein